MRSNGATTAFRINIFLYSFSEKRRECRSFRLKSVRSWKPDHPTADLRISRADFFLAEEREEGRRRRRSSPQPRRAMAAATMSALRAPAPAPSVGDHRRSRSVIARVRRVRRVRESVSKASIDRRSISRRVSPPSLTRRLLPLSSQAAPARPNFRVNLGKGTVSVDDPKEEAASARFAASSFGSSTDTPYPCRG